jgi:hypothetical protein
MHSPSVFSTEIFQTTQSGTNACRTKPQQGYQKMIQNHTEKWKQDHKDDILLNKSRNKVETNDNSSQTLLILNSKANLLAASSFSCCIRFI